MTDVTYNIHTIGWQAFQDLAVAVAEECLKRPVQVFLPSKDAGRDGAFIGAWDDPASATTHRSTIQCKFTSKAGSTLSLSHLSDDLEKAATLGARGLAQDYVIITNYEVSGDGELKIIQTFESRGVGKCRVFGLKWIVEQIKKSARLRMMVPRLYGLGDLSNILDERAYAQAKMILSTMGNDLQRLVVTDAHRRSVRAISSHNFVLLLGAPASGKSTIGASLAVGAADLWNSFTIRATTPADLKAHINPHEKQFFWIDDAWGSTQYQRHNIDEWNQVLPLIQSAIHRGSQFLLTSRDYIWKQAYKDLKTHALPLLDKSRVVINVQKLTEKERAQILYNHMKLGDQPTSFKTTLKPIMPKIVASDVFLPESARRLGSTFFAGSLHPTETSVKNFFENQSEFLLQTITNLSADCIAAIGLIFLKGSRVASPVAAGAELDLVTDAFGVERSAVKNALGYLDGSLVLLAHDETGPYWAFKHPTVGDAFALYVARNPELTEIYLRGAKPELLLREVVCAGVTLHGAPVRVPTSMYEMLIERIRSEQTYSLKSFLSYRADAEFARRLLAVRPDLLNGLKTFIHPIKDDSDATLLARLHVLGILQEELRLNFLEQIKDAAVENGDASFLVDSDLKAVMTEDELDEILTVVEREFLPRVGTFIERLKDEWSPDYDPDDYFNDLRDSVSAIVGEVSWRSDHTELLERVELAIDRAKIALAERYEEPERTRTPATAENKGSSELSELFRDVDE